MNKTNQLLEPKKILTTGDLTHPGMNDINYIQRRKAIAQKAILFRNQKIPKIPHVSYTKQEHDTWKLVTEQLTDLHGKHANNQYLQAKKKLQISTHKIPQMAELNKKVYAFHGMQLAPVEGLVDSRTFLSLLADKTMFCTQYIRHHSAPFFTPEPDVIHEFVGHVPTFTDGNIVRLSASIGQAAKKANEKQLLMIERIYWFTLEYGMIEEKNTPKLFGAGLLGGISDLKQAVDSEGKVLPFTIDQVVETSYDFDTMQDFYFIIPSFEWLTEVVLRFLQKEHLI